MEKFLKVIDKAKTACTNAKQNLSDHFVEVNKMVLNLKSHPAKTKMKKVR